VVIGSVAHFSIDCAGVLLFVRIAAELVREAMWTLGPL
jgi:hypothetical protein